MKFTFLGTCSGTEPMPGKHHTSITLEHESRLYWLDTGECCSHTAYVSGIEVAATEAVFISHTHIDHIGGLPNLLWTMKKVASRYPEALDRLNGRTVRVFLPDLALGDSIVKIAFGNETDELPFDIRASRYGEGVIYERHGVRATARHNDHLGDSAPYKSYSFRIEADSRSIVYSGDVKSLTELDPLLEDCDLFLMETGHHEVEVVCNYFTSTGFRVGRLVFMHHGRSVLNDPSGQLRTARRFLGNKVAIANEGMVIEM